MAVDAFGDHIPGTPRTGDLGMFYGTTLVINPSAEAWPGVTPVWDGAHWVDPNGGIWNPQPAAPQPVDNSGAAAFAQAVVAAFVTFGASVAVDAGAAADAGVAVDAAPVIDSGAPLN